MLTKVKKPLFHEAVGAWFEAAFAAPTAAQTEAWPAIKAGRNVLIAAPTGSGKTLAAFMAAIDDLVRQGVEGGLSDETQVVYVSPLKALSNDIQRNLEAPLAGTRTVIVDEIHAIAPNKRGSHLALSLERLSALCGDRLLRIGLSATQNPIDE